MRKFALVAGAVLLGGLLLAIVLVVPLGRNGEQALYFYCGAGLRPAVAEIVEAFTAETTIPVECDYAGSGMLISRVRLAQTGDLFMPGDVWYLDQLAEHGLVESKEMVTYFEPVIIVPKENPAGIRGLADLERPGVRLGLGNPAACQIGRITQKIFEKNDIDAAAIAKNLTFSSMTVNELGLQLATGRIDAAIVWDAIAAYYPDAATVVRIPLGQNEISHVAIGVLSSTTNKAAAHSFVDFITSQRGKEIFAKHHYRTEPPDESGAEH